MGIVGLGAAAELCAEPPAHVLELAARLEEGLRTRFPDVHIHGAEAQRIGNTVNASFPGAEGEPLLIALDLEGIALSSGSACTVGSLEPSHVLLAMGLPPDLAHGALRFSLGRDNTEAEVDRVLEILPALVERVRAVGP